MGCLVVLLVFARFFQRYVCCLELINGFLRMLSLGGECRVRFSLARASLPFAKLDKSLLHLCFDSLAIGRLSSNHRRCIDLAPVHGLSFYLANLGLQAENERCLTHALLQLLPFFTSCSRRWWVMANQLAHIVRLVVYLVPSKFKMRLLEAAWFQFLSA